MRMRNLGMKTVVKVAFGFWRMQRETARERVNFHFTSPCLVSCSMGHPQPTSLCSPGLYKCHQLCPTLSLTSAHAQTNTPTHATWKPGGLDVGCWVLSPLKTTRRTNSYPLFLLRISPVIGKCLMKPHMSSSHPLSPHNFPPGSVSQSVNRNWLIFEITQSEYMSLWSEVNNCVPKDIKTKLFFGFRWLIIMSKFNSARWEHYVSVLVPQHWCSPYE